MSTLHRWTLSMESAPAWEKICLRLFPQYSQIPRQKRGRAAGEHRGVQARYFDIWVIFLERLHADDDAVGLDRAWCNAQSFVRAFEVLPSFTQAQHDAMWHDEPYINTRNRALGRYFSHDGDPHVSRRLRMSYNLTHQVRMTEWQSSSANGEIRWHPQQTWAPYPWPCPIEPFWMIEHGSEVRDDTHMLMEHTAQSRDHMAFDSAFHIWFPPAGPHDINTCGRCVRLRGKTLEEMKDIIEEQGRSYWV